MKYKVVLSDKAKADLAKIYGYILNKLQSTINADAVLERLYSSMEDLSFMADSYTFTQMSPGIQWAYAITQSEIIQLFTLLKMMPPQSFTLPTVGEIWIR